MTERPWRRQKKGRLSWPASGSLGKLEEISIQLAGITGKVINEMKRSRLIVLARDNGVVAEGVAATPQSVTLAQQ